MPLAGFLDCCIKTDDFVGNEYFVEPKTANAQTGCFSVVTKVREMEKKRENNSHSHIDTHTRTHTFSHTPTSRPDASPLWPR